MIEVKNADFCYGKRKVIESASINARDGEILAILGSNGAGKSTLLKVMSGWLKASSGSVSYNGVNISDIPERQLSQMRSVLEQECNVAFDYTVGETVQLSLYASSYSNVGERVSSALSEVGLEGFEKRKYSELSGGEKRRVQLARALCQLGIGKERIGKSLLLDEPSAGLDPANANAAMSAAMRAARDGASVVAILHDPNLACRCASRIVLMKNGKILAEDLPEKIMAAGILSETYSSPCEVFETRLGKFCTFPPRSGKI